MAYLANLTRPERDPKILNSGPGSMSFTDRLGRFLGWFSLALGVAELLVPRAITRALGMEGRETLIRAYGMREIGAGVVSLSLERELGLTSRVAGDALDLVTLAACAGPSNNKRSNVSTALLMVAGIALIDVLATAATASRHRRSPQDRHRTYRDRSGFPKGIEASRGAARAFPNRQVASPRITSDWAGAAG